MKALHKITDPKDANPRFGFIQVKAGFVYAGNSNAGVRIPVDEVFPKGLIKEDEVLYFKAEEWSKTKLYEAQMISREGLVFSAHKRGKVTGHAVAIDQGKFVKDYGNYPDFDAVIPEVDTQPISASNIWLTGKYLSAIYEALDYSNDVPTLSFVGHHNSNGTFNALVRFKKGAGIGVLCIINRGDIEPSVSAEEDLSRVENTDLAALKEAHAQELKDLEDGHEEALDELKKELAEANEKIKELEAEAAEPIDPEDLDDAQLLTVFGTKPIVVIPQNALDEHFVEALAKLTGKGRPHELMKVLEQLDNPRVLQQVEELSEVDALLY